MLSFDNLIQQLFYRWGSIAYRFRFILFIGPILLTIALSFGFLFIKKQTTIDPEYVFSPKNAQWRYEKKVLSDYWPLNEQEFWPGKSYDYTGYVDIIAAGIKHPKFGRPNMLVLKYLDELERINQHIIHNITISVTHNDITYEVGFTDLCMSYDWKCFMNEHVTMLMPKERWGNFDSKLAEFTDDIINNEVKITYPIGWRGTEPIYFGALIGAPHIIDKEGHFNYVRAVRLTYNVRDEKVGNISYLWRKKVAGFLSDVKNPASNILEFGMYHNESLPEGLQQVADSLSPKFAITCFVLFSLCGLSAIVLYRHNDGFITIDWVRSKPTIALAGLFCPLLAIISAFGLILWMGFLYNAIVNVSPFIVFCIGVDDMFIMSAAWHRTNVEQSVSHRLSESLAEAAVAISITTITDMLTFGIGCLTTLPSVQMFCFYTFMGIAFTYLYQLTFFTAVMAFSGKRESDGLHAITLKPVISQELADNLFKKLFLTGSVSLKSKIPPEIVQENVTKNEKVVENVKTTLSQKMRKKFMDFKQSLNKELPKSKHRETMISKIFREHYGPFLLDCFTMKVFIFIYIIYLSLAILGCTMLKEGLNPKFLVLDSFYLSKFYILMDETFWEEGLQMQVVVNSPPDLFNPKERKEFQNMLNDFENTEYTMRHNATMIWLDAYEKKLRDDYNFSKIPLPKTSEEWYGRCREWLISAGGRRLWEKDMVWGKNESDPKTYNHLFAFRFQLGLRNYKTPTDHMRSAILMRKISAKYIKFNITTFHEYYPFADQYIELKPALIRNCLLAMLSMLIVSFIMIPSWIAAFVIAFAIFSIDIGVIGFMTFWGVRLESVSIITVIMSIGFAVDLSAHIGYAYVKSNGNQHEKAISALETIGWPVFMGALSTVLGILVLATVQAYIVQIFFKTVFLVIIFSMIHGLILLPIFLTIILK
uniref:SSD domain-containing protein n=3 Tax=Wuchereria bancrofti TaxID=6293 RepID=A0AAF5PS05_WUCBA